MSTVVHIIGTGTIGEPVIGLFTDFREHLGVDEVTFHKRTPLASDRAKLEHLMARGARLATDRERVGDFEALGHKVTYTAGEALARATVVIDCTPAGNTNKQATYLDPVLGHVKGFLAQGSEFDFGKPYARGINEKSLDAENDRFLQIVSCNTHNIATLVKNIAIEDGESHLESATFVCMRRANDISQASSFVPAPSVGKHGDARFGTHHAHDAYHLFETLNLDLNLFSSAVKLNTQYMHSIWFSLRLNRDITKDEICQRLYDSPWVAVTDKRQANLIFSFGRDHGYYGRILSQTVVVEPTLVVRGGREVYGFCFTPQDGNSLLSSVAGGLWRIDPDWDSVRRRLKPLQRWVYQEI